MATTVLDGVIPPLRPFAAKLLRYITPYWQPKRLTELFQRHIEQNHDKWRLLTSKWEAPDWALLARAVSNPSRFLSLTSIDDLMTHVTFQVTLEEAVFQFYSDGSSRLPLMMAPGDLLQIHEAVLLAHLQRIGDAAVQRRRMEQYAAAITELFGQEQNRSERAAEDAGQRLQKYRDAFETAGKQIAAAKAASISQRAELARLEQKTVDNRNDARKLAVRGEERVHRLQSLQEKRRAAIAVMNASARQTIDQLDRLCDDTLKEIGQIAEEARRLQREATTLANAIAKVEAQHATQAQAVYQSARTAAAQTIQHVVALRGTWIGPRDTTAEWRRIKTTLGRQPEGLAKLLAQLTALRLWHLDGSETNPQRQERAQQAAALAREIETALAQWQQPSLRGATQ